MTCRAVTKHTSTPIRYKATLAILSVVLAAGATKTVQSAETYSPSINPREFSARIAGNPYFSLPVGSKFVYEAKTDEGLERAEILVPGWTKVVMGVETLVYWDRVYLDGELVEDTRDYLAQHANGDVWYFGEDVENYENGIVVDRHGTWIAGVDDALPGIWVKANPTIGEKYRQEYQAGEAEDVAKVVSLTEAVETSLGRFSDCMETLDWSPLAPDKESKYYCKTNGITTLEIDLDEGIRTELVDVDATGAIGVALPPEYAGQGVVAAE